MHHTGPTTFISQTAAGFDYSQAELEQDLADGEVRWELECHECLTDSYNSFNSCSGRYHAAGGWWNNNGSWCDGGPMQWWSGNGADGADGGNSGGNFSEEAGYYDDQDWTQWQAAKNSKRNRKRNLKRRAKGGDSNKSTLKVFFANVTKLGKSATTYLINRPEHVLLAVETHVRGQEAQRVMDDVTFRGWTPIMAAAVKAEDNPMGNQGGAMVLHKPWLQTATPAVAEGPLGRDLPEDDLAWKHFRIKGLHIVIGAIYFDHTIKLAGPNLHKFKRAVHLTDNGRRMLVLPGDFNMEPDEWDQQLLQDAGLQILTAGNEKTCKTSHGSKQNDYIIVSIDLVPFIKNLKVEADVP